MADLSVTAASVVPGTNASLVQGTAAVAVTAGQPVYGALTALALTDANLSDAAAAAVGIAVCNAAIGQPVMVQTAGDITIGATMVVGAIYCCSANAGGIAPSADVTTGWRTFILGTSLSATVMTLVMKAASTITTHA